MRLKCMCLIFIASFCILNTFRLQLMQQLIRGKVVHDLHQRMPPPTSISLAVNLLNDLI